MRPSSLGGVAYCVALCLSVCPSVRPSRSRMYFVYSCTVLRAKIQNRKTSVFAYGPASCMYFSAHAEGRISYGHLGRTNSCYMPTHTADEAQQFGPVFDVVRPASSWSCMFLCACNTAVKDGGAEIICSHHMPKLPECHSAVVH